MKKLNLNFGVTPWRDFDKYKCIFLIIMLSLLCCSPIISQSDKVDSLTRLIKLTKPDTNVIDLLLALGDNYNDLGMLDSSRIVFEKSLEIANHIDHTRSIARASNRLAIWHKNQGNYGLAIEFYKKAISIHTNLGNKKGIAGNVLNIGNVYLDQGKYTKAIDCFLKSLKIAEEIKDKTRIVASALGLGHVYTDLKDYKKAEDYYMLSLKISEEMDSKEKEAASLGNLGQLFAMQGIHQKAMTYHKRALAVAEQAGDLSTISVVLGNIGAAYASMGDYSNGMRYLLESLEKQKALGDKSGIANTLGNIGSLYILQKKYKQAEKFLLESIALAKEIGERLEIINSTNNLSELYLIEKDYKKAYEFLKEYHDRKDSLFTIEKQKDITRKEMNYEFEKKEALTKAEHDKQIAIADTEKKRQRLFSGLILAIASSITVIALIIFRSLRISKKQKHIIEKQKALVEEHQKEIIDSITYAKRIQDAILPPLEMVKQKLPDSFVLYKPKDIVAGDFYWMEEFDNIIFIAAADCTGHGVPGAMVSMVCSNSLTRAVKEFGLRDTGQILDKVRALVLETFEKSAEDVKDGMDISLLSIDQQHKIINWSGANNPLWYIEKNTTSSEVTSSHVTSSEVEKGVEKEVEKDTETTPKFVEAKADVPAENSFKSVEVKADESAETFFKFFEVKADKQPIGKTENPKPFTTHNIEFKEGTEFFLFTDGLADQFGGPIGKKYKYKQFADMLTNNYIFGLEDQVKKIDQSFEEWKGNLEQVDDVCVIGLRI